MRNVLDKAIDQAKATAPHHQEILGQVLQAALNGESLTLVEAEKHHEHETTLKGLAEAERGEGMSFEAFQSSMNKFRATLKKA